MPAQLGAICCPEEDGLTVVIDTLAKLTLFSHSI